MVINNYFYESFHSTVLSSTYICLKTVSWNDALLQGHSSLRPQCVQILIKLAKAPYYQLSPSTLVTFLYQAYERIN